MKKRKKKKKRFDASQLVNNFLKDFIAAKVSKNLGRYTATTGNNFYFPAGTLGTMETKTHHLQRPIDRYFAEKIGKEASKIDDPEEEEQSVESAILLKEREVKRLKDIIKAEQKKVKICYECKRKFTSTEQLKRHEGSSEIHKQNIEKNKPNTPDAPADTKGKEDETVPMADNPASSEGTIQIQVSNQTPQQ